MAIYYIVSSVLLTVPFVAAAAMVIYALSRKGDVKAGLWSKRFGFSLNARERPSVSPRQSWATSASGVPSPPNQPPRSARVRRIKVHCCLAAPLALGHLMVLPAPQWLLALLLRLLNHLAERLYVLRGKRRAIQATLGCVLRRLLTVPPLAAGPGHARGRDPGPACRRRAPGHAAAS